TAPNLAFDSKFTDLYWNGGQPFEKVPGNLIEITQRPSSLNLPPALDPNPPVYAYPPRRGTFGGAPPAGHTPGPDFVVFRNAESDIAGVQALDLVDSSANPVNASGVLAPGLKDALVGLDLDPNLLPNLPPNVDPIFTTYQANADKWQGDWLKVHNASGIV